MATSDSPLNVPNVTLAVARGIGPGGNTDIPAFYIPEILKFISWDAPVLAHTGVDIDYKMTAYDWYDRALSWSVTGPTGMTIDADGTLHWVPSTDLTSEAVTVECSLGGQETLSKTFTCEVDNSRCVFVATTGSDTTGDGSVGNPLATFEEASKLVSGATTSRTVYHRAGTYAKDPMSFYGGLSSMNTLAEKTWPDGTAFLVRNYPGEFVKYHLLSGGGWRFYGGGTVVYGMDVQGAGDAGTGKENGTEQGGVVISGETVAKRMSVYDYACEANGNCCGYRHTASTLLDQCQGWDNFDRTDPNNPNNKNFNGFATGEISKGTYVIDCLSDGLDGKRTQCGFFLKHAGDNPPHYHKCADTGNPESFTAICNKMTIRHCVSVGGIGHGRTDEITQGIVNTDEGFLVQHCVVVDTGTTLFSFAPWQEAVIAANPPAYFDNELIGFSSADANVFQYGQYTSSSGYADWDMLFSRNKLYTPSPSNACRVKGVLSDLTTLTSKGVNNEILSAPKDYAFSAAGRNFQIIDGICSEVL